jgi:5-methylcytosine-specific restriction endonuclease McrA
MLVERYSDRLVVDSRDQVPPILVLNSGGEPLTWITYQQSAFYKAKNKILWTIQGPHEVILRGGTNAITGLRSEMRIDTIIAVDNDTSPSKYRKRAPALTNRDLFARDRHLCAYCGTQYSATRLTRDHIKPRSKGGPDIWENVVAACRGCNQRKDDRNPEQAGMQLLFVPYTPSHHEKLILMNRKILCDQMDFLIKGVGRNSRLHAYVEGGQLLM